MAAKAKKKAMKKSKAGKSVAAVKKSGETTAELIRYSATPSSARSESVAKANADSASFPSVMSANSSGRPMLGPTAIPSPLPFFSQSSVTSSVRAPKTCGTTDSPALAAVSQKMSQQSKGKPLTVSLLQQEARSVSQSSLSLPSIQHQLAAGSQSVAFSLINSQLRKAADSGVAAVLVAPPGSTTPGVVKCVPAGVPPRATYSLSNTRVSLPPVSSVNVGLSSANSASVAYASSVPGFGPVSKPVVARLMAQQRLPGVLALSGAMIRNVGVRPTVLMTASDSSVTLSASTSTSAMKPYVVATIVDPSEGVLTSQPLSIGVSSTAPVTGQQLEGPLRPPTASSRSASMGSMPSTVPTVQFISKPVQIPQSTANSTPQLLSALSTVAQQRASSSAQVYVRTKSRQSETVSQILQQTAAAGTTPTRMQLPASVTDPIRPTVVQHGPPKISAPKTPGNMRWISSLGQTRLVMPSDKGIVITQLPPESGMVRTQMFIQQRAARTELVPQPPTAGAASPGVLSPTAKLNASLQLVRALSNVSGQKLSAGSQPGTYVLSATQPTSDTVQLQVVPSPMSATARPAARPSAAPVFARLLGPGSGIRLAGILPGDVETVQQPRANTKPLVTVTSMVTTKPADQPVPSTSSS